MTGLLESRDSNWYVPHPAEGPRATTVKVRNGDQVGIDVDSDLPATGWVIYDPVSKTNANVQKDHWFTFDAEFGDARTAYLEVHQVRPTGTGPTDLVQVLGIWRFVFQLDES